MPYTEALLKSIPRIEDSRRHPAAGHPGPAARPRRPARRAAASRPAARYTQDEVPRARTPPLVDRGRPRVPLLVPGRHAEPRRRARPVEPVDAGERRLMAGTGTAHLRDGDDVLLRVERPRRRVPRRRGPHGRTPSRASASTSSGARRSASSASRARGKSTTGRAVMQLPPPTSGQRHVRRARADHGLDGDELRKMRPRVQMVFQDPISSLNPRRRVRDIVGRAAARSGRAARPSDAGQGRRGARRRRPRRRPRSATAGRTSSPAGSASASRSPARSCSTPSC